MTCTTHHYACDCREDSLNDLLLAVAEFIDICCKAEFAKGEKDKARKVCARIDKLAKSLAPIPKVTH